MAAAQQSPERIFSFYGRLVFLDVLRSSFVCGLAGALTSNPVDVVRTRMMNQRGAALYQGTLDCLLQVSENNSVCLHFECFKPPTVSEELLVGQK